MKKLCKRCKAEFEPPRNGQYCKKCKDTYWEWNSEALDRMVEKARRAECRPKYRDGNARENTWETKSGG